MPDRLLEAVTLTQWRSAFASPGGAEWVVGGLYAAVSLLALALAVRSARSALRAAALLAVATVALSAAAVLDLPDYVTRVARTCAVLEGWYDARWEVQAWLVAGACCVAVLAAPWVRAFGRCERSFRAALLCLGALAAFVAVRAVSLHEIDALLKLPLAGGLEAGRVVEAALLVSFAFALLAALGRGWVAALAGAGKEVTEAVSAASDAPAPGPGEAAKALPRRERPVPPLRRRRAEPERLRVF